MNKSLIVQADHYANKNGVTRHSQITQLICDAAQGADERQTKPFPSKMDGAAGRLAL